MKFLQTIFRGRHSFLFGVAFTLCLLLSAGGLWWYLRPATPDFEITDQLGGNLFPSAVLAVATTGAEIVAPADTFYVGNPKSCFAVRVRSPRQNCPIRVTLEQTAFFSRSVSEFVLPEAGVEYTVYPEVLWNYDRLQQNRQAQPVDIVVSVELAGRDCGRQLRTFSVRGINECLLGYVQQLPGGKTRFRSTKQLFAAYVNEDNPQIDALLREALNTRLVRRFQGYQLGGGKAVDDQVFALWYVLQQRNFRYSSISNSSLSSNVAYSQRVRTFSAALQSSQINCVDGSALFASLLRAINITPVLVKLPGHMFVGYYDDVARTKLTFLETTMIGDVDLDEYFPEEKLDSTIQGLTRKQASRITFDKSKEYAERKYQQNRQAIESGKTGYMMLEISKRVRRDIQPLAQ